MTEEKSITYFDIVEKMAELKKIHRLKKEDLLKKSIIELGANENKIDNYILTFKKQEKYIKKYYKQKGDEKI